MAVDTIALLKAAVARRAAMTPAQRRAHDAADWQHEPAPMLPTGPEVIQPVAVRTQSPRPAARGLCKPKGPWRAKVSDVDRLMDVARKLGPVFTLSDLAVAAWQEYPDRFGMAGGYPYPDSHKVAAMMSARSGPVKRGMLRRVGPNRYTVTEAKP